MDVATAKGDAMDEQAQTASGNGAAGPKPQVTATRTAMRPRDARQLRFSHSFAQVVAVMMRDPNFRKMRLADLEWLALPPIMAGQFKLAQMPSTAGGAKGQGGEKGNGQEGSKGAGQDGGVLVPVAVALWARVSDTIDKQLSESLDKAVRLGPGDWASGSNIWLMAVAGDKRAVPKFIEQLAQTEFKGQRVKMRVRGPDNAVVVKTIG